jgi:ATPase subunit of ABC transporter with duplicated ATPase domains
MRVLQNVPDTPRQIGGDMTELKSITIRGAREHNLKNVDLDLPRDSLIVMTGLSGSGKSRSPSIPSMPRASAAMWKACRLMPGSFWR